MPKNLNKNYNFISDYEKLYNLITKGIKVIAYIEKDWFDENFQICEIFISNFGYEGRVFGCLFFCGKTKQDFLNDCKRYNLQYLEPLNI